MKKRNALPRLPYHGGRGFCLTTLAMYAILKMKTEKGARPMNNKTEATMMYVPGLCETFF